MNSVFRRSGIYNSAKNMAALLSVLVFSGTVCAQENSKPDDQQTQKTQIITKLPQEKAALVNALLILRKADKEKSAHDYTKKNLKSVIEDAVKFLAGNQKDEAKLQKINDVRDAFIAHVWAEGGQTVKTLGFDVDENLTDEQAKLVIIVQAIMQEKPTLNGQELFAMGEIASLSLYPLALKTHGLNSDQAHEFLFNPKTGPVTLLIHYIEKGQFPEGSNKELQKGIKAIADPFRVVGKWPQGVYAIKCAVSIGETVVKEMKSSREKVVSANKPLI